MVSIISIKNGAKLRRKSACCTLFKENLKFLSVPAQYSTSYLMKSELDIQQSKQEILVQRHEHEKCPHEYFSSGVIFALRLTLSRGSPSIFVIMASPLAKVQNITAVQWLECHGPQRINPIVKTSHSLTASG